MARVKRINDKFSAQYDLDGTPGWMLAATVPEGITPPSGESDVRGLRCSDLSKLTNERDRSRVCSSEFGYVVVEPGQPVSSQQPGNAPLGIATISTSEGPRTIAFMLPRFACPRQCGELEYTQAFVSKSSHKSISY